MRNFIIIRISAPQRLKRLIARMNDHDTVLDSLAKLRLHAELNAPDPRADTRGSDASVDGDGGEAPDDLTNSVDSTSVTTAAQAIHAHNQHAQREGYGFRPISGSSTPLKGKGRQSPLPDPNGLGWPAKSTLSRLNSSPAERAAREEKLAGAVRTLLECIGEDPDREGLRRTPERYAQALMWMTRGYEERLAGEQLTLAYRRIHTQTNIRDRCD